MQALNGEKWRVLTPILVSILIAVVSILGTVNAFILVGFRDDVSELKIEIKAGAKKLDKEIDRLVDKIERDAKTAAKDRHDMNARLIIVENTRFTSVEGYELEKKMLRMHQELKDLLLKSISQSSSRSKFTASTAPKGGRL